MLLPSEDIRAIPLGGEYWVITDPTNGGRCLKAGMFTAAFRSRKAAKEAATRLHSGGSLAKGYGVVRQVKD